MPHVQGCILSNFKIINPFTDNLKHFISERYGYCQKLSYDHTVDCTTDFRDSRVQRKIIKAEYCVP